MTSTDVDVIRQKELSRDQYLKELRDALNKKGLGHVEFHDQLLVKFLRAKLYKIDETCNTIAVYASNFVKYPEFFESVDFVRKAVEDRLFQILPQRNKTGEVICVLRPGLWQPREVKFRTGIATTLYAFEIAEMEEETQINGAIEIIDMQNVGMKQFLNIGISEIKLMANMSENALPIRWRKIFVVFENYFTDIIYGMAKPFLSKDFKEKIAFIGQDFTQLHQLVPSELLPPRYGGTAENYDSKEYFNHIKSKESDLQKLWEPFKKQV